ATAQISALRHAVDTVLLQSFRSSPAAATSPSPLAAPPSSLGIRPPLRSRPKRRFSMIWVDNVRYARVNNPDHGKANRVPVPRRPRSERACERVTVKADGEGGGARAKGSRRPGVEGRGG